MHISEVATNNDLAEGGAPKIVRNRLRADVWVVEANGSHGSASDSHDVELAAAKLTPKLSGRVADLRSRQQPAITGPW